MRPNFAVPLLATALLLTACERAGESTTTTTVTTEEKAPAGADRNAPPAPPPIPATAVPTGPRPFDQVASDGIGDFRLGATLANVRRAIPGLEVDEAMEGSTCRYIEDVRRDGVAAMLGDGDRIVRVDVDEGDIATDRGIRIGSTAAQVRAAYPGVVEEPHNYTDGKYLKVRSPDRATGLVFETDASGKVERYRVGRWDEVQWVEGCS